MNTEIYFYKTNIDVEFYQEFEEPEIFVFRIDQDTYIGSFNKNISILHRSFKRPAKIEYYGYLGKIVYTEEELSKPYSPNYHFRSSSYWIKILQYFINKEGYLNEKISYSSIIEKFIQYYVRSTRIFK